MCPGAPEPGLAAGPTEGGTFLLQRLHFWVTPHGAFTCVLDRGKMLAAPPGTWSRPSGHAADGLPAPLCSSKQTPKASPAPGDTSEHRGVCTGLAAIARAWLSPSTGDSSAGLPPASSAPLAGKKHHLRGLLSRVRRGCKWKHSATSLLGDRGRQTAPRLGGTRAAGKTWHSLSGSLASAPGKGARSPSALSHLTPGLAEIWALFPCRAARCSQHRSVHVSLGLLPARDAAPHPRIAIKQCRALECFWESAGIRLHMNSPAQFRLQPRGYF